MDVEYYFGNKSISLIKPDNTINEGINKQDIEYDSNLTNIKELGIRNDIKTWFGLKEEYLTLAYHGKKIIGYILCYEDMSNGNSATFDHEINPHLPRKSPTDLHIEPVNVVYIGEVSIIKEYQGKGLCTKMLDFTINKFKEMNKNVLHIWNNSDTFDGVPACKCYTKTGINNDYIMIVRNKESKTRPKYQKYETLESLECIIPLPGRIYFYFNKNYYYSDEMTYFREQIDSLVKTNEEQLNGMKRKELRYLAIELGATEEDIENANEVEDIKQAYIELVIRYQQSKEESGAKKFKKKSKKLKRKSKLSDKKRKSKVSKKKIFKKKNI
jgi:ribosomal protein S18 acetylase RimI-like enzyme